MPTQYLPVAVANRIMASQKPSISSVISAYPHFRIEARTLKKSAIPIGQKQSCIFGMNLRTDLSAAPVIERNTEIVERRAVYVDTLTIRIHNRDELRREVQDLAQLLLACAHGSGHFLV